jgi:myo-inositol-1(or 4)-monophosphatase
MSRYARELATAVEAARAAAEIQLSLRGRVGTREKADRSLVTEADLASEEAILPRLRAAFPDDSILSEEAGESGPNSGRQWIVDPLDGTTNFSRGQPIFAVSIALWEDGAPAVGVVLIPVLDELFTATRDVDALLNGQPIRVSGVGSVREAMINCYFDRHGLLEPGLRVFNQVARACEGRVKILGSTASMLCFVACGRLDAQMRNKTNLWDFAAGALVLERAGGIITDFQEQPLLRTGQSLLGTNGSIHAELAEIATSDDGGE